MYVSPLKDLTLFFKHGSKLGVEVIKPEHSLRVNAINDRTIRIMNILFKISPNIYFAKVDIYCYWYIIKPNWEFAYNIKILQPKEFETVKSLKSYKA
jgi:hypothetical protein